ncbi:Uncharacterized protein TCM_012988 [Theobroma cacao]|uniref:Uncharacterized protein n=1 Tax=Theobroma cacao TaxID=3641 RepID=A0A061FWI6_THECC|nr:Uncharacterized protein TCM_012988 [Theobroma cacao]
MAPKRERSSASGFSYRSKFVSMDVVTRDNNSLVNKVPIQEKGFDKALICYLGIQARKQVSFHSQAINDFYETLNIEDDGYGQYLREH